MNRRTAIVATIAFLIVISTPMVLMAFGVRPTINENRPLNPLPEIGESSLTDAATYEQLGDYIADRIPLRDVAIATDARVDLSVFRQSPNPEVIVGSDGWLFMELRGPSLCANRAQASTLIDQVDDVLAAIRRSGRDVRMLSAPAKLTIYPEFAPDDAEAGCATDTVNAVRLAAETRSVEGYIDVWEELRQRRETTLLYYLTDTHWNGEGAALAAAELIGSLDTTTWDPTAVATTPRDLETDLSLMLGLPTVDTTPAVITTVGELAVIDDGDDRTRRLSSTYEGAVPGTTLVIFDSFGIPMERLIAPYFEESVWVHWRELTDFDSPEVFVELATDADTVVIESLDMLMFPRMRIWERNGSAEYFDANLPPR